MSRAAETCSFIDYYKKKLKRNSISAKTKVGGWGRNVVELGLTRERYMMVQLNLLATDFFFQILAHPVFKM